MTSKQIARLLERKWTVKHVKQIIPWLSNSVINDWLKKGMILGHKVNSRQFRFSGLEIIHIAIIDALSKLGTFSENIAQWPGKNIVVRLVDNDVTVDRHLWITDPQAIMEYCQRHKYEVVVVIRFLKHPFFSFIYPKKDPRGRQAGILRGVRFMPVEMEHMRFDPRPEFYGIVSVRQLAEIVMENLLHEEIET